MAYPAFRDPDAPVDSDSDIRLGDPPTDEETCPRCFSPMKSWEKRCKVCGFAEGDEEEEEVETDGTEEVKGKVVSVEKDDDDETEVV